jgi:hypothetical protein
MNTVTVIHHARHYRRSVNGAWLGAPPTNDRHEGVDPHTLPSWTVGDGWLEIIWPDGVKESVHCHRSCMPGYPDEPIGKRVAAIYAAARAKRP